MANKEPLVPGWEPLGGTSRRYRNVETGQILPRRQFDKLRGISYEKKAEYSRARDPAAFYLRPARGRSSARKLEGEFAQQVAEERKAAQQAAREAERAATAESRRLREVRRKTNRRVKQKVIRPQLLKPGHKAERISFDTYEGYLKAIHEMRAMRVTVNGRRERGIIGYVLGIVGVVDKNGKETLTGATLTRLQNQDNEPLSESELFAVTEQYLETRPYFMFLHWTLQVSFNIHYAREKAGRHRK